MSYVGWKDVKSALRYVDAGDSFAGHFGDNGGLIVIITSAAVEMNGPGTALYTATKSAVWP